MEDFNAEESIMKEFSLTDKQAKFVILVTGGMTPIDAVKESYSFSSDTNVYKQLKDMVNNPKIDTALKALGMNMRDKFEKNAISIIVEWEKIAYSEKTATRDKLAALKELAAYNPMLLTQRKKDTDDTEEEDLAKRVGEWINEE